MGLGEREQKGGIRVLDAPVQMKNFDSGGINESGSIWLSGARDDGTLVDQKKLQKAENKIKQKQEKRLTEGPKAVSNPAQECQASAAQVGL